MKANPVASNQQKFESLSSVRPLWIATFASSAGVLAFSLVYLVAFAQFGGYRTLGYVVGAFSALLCIFAAWKLKDAERAAAAVDGS